ncbi:DUF559 domain-containing protein [Nocardia sp. NPDC052566]|uniref:DUF559 domain-containing protein n=1 Tax=Nocardia sp. NPDC052566 TaxID=3364330 RepID=UPI0037C8659A
MTIHGVHTRDQLLSQGISATTIDRRCRQGRYSRLLPRTYCLGAPNGLARCAAIVAWIPAAVLSHRTAAWLRNMLPEPDIFEATVPKSIHRDTPKWLTLYRRDLPATAIDEAWGLPTLSPAYTLLDCVAVMPQDAADRLVDEHLGRTVAADDVLDLCRSGKNGSPALRRQLREAALHSASEPERLFARALARRNLSMLANHWVGPYICDFVHEQSRTIVEIDGREFHSAPETFRHDRRRQNWLLRNDWLVLRYAAYDVYNALDACVSEVQTVIRQRRRKT